MKLLDGKKVAADRKKRLQEDFSKLSFTPKLAIVQVGDVAESNVYVGHKVKFAETIGVHADVVKFPETITTDELMSEIEALNEDNTIQGVIVQLPIPESLNKERIINAVHHSKDVDGLTARSMWRMMDADPTFVPATTYGIITLLEAYDISIEGKDVVIVGASLSVGKVTALYFLYHKATVTICHSKTADLAKHTKNADIVVVAAGRKGLITKDHVRSGQTVIDVGINRVGKKLYGDVAFDEVSEIVDYISPVPGGVGQLTVASLFENMLKAIQEK